MTDSKQHKRLDEIGRTLRHAQATRRTETDSWLNGYQEDVSWLLQRLEELQGANGEWGTVAGEATVRVRELEEQYEEARDLLEVEKQKHAVTKRWESTLREEKLGLLEQNQVLVGKVAAGEIAMARVDALEEQYEQMRGFRDECERQFQAKNDEIMGLLEQLESVLERLRLVDECSDALIEDGYGYLVSASGEDGRRPFASDLPDSPGKSGEAESTEMSMSVSPESSPANSPDAAQ